MRSATFFHLRPKNTTGARPDLGSSRVLQLTANAERSAGRLREAVDYLLSASLTTTVLHLSFAFHRRSYQSSHRIGDDVSAAKATRLVDGP
jgi:hypothetical protein